MPTLHTPCDDTDLYSDEVHLDPHPHFKRLRDIGPAVWLTANEVWAIPRYHEVRQCLRNTDTFISGEGVALNGPFNAILKGNVVTSDGDLHNRLRRVIAGPMLPKALTEVADQIEHSAVTIVEKLVAQGTFDAVTDLAQYLPVTLVTDFVGLSEEGREHMLEWAAAGFDALGPMNARADAAVDHLQAAVSYIQGCVAERLVRPGSWGDGIFQALDRGDVGIDNVPGMLMDYIFPSLDTTINATSTLIMHLAQSPEQYDLLRQDQELIPGAINEAVRLESPIRQFSRLITKDIEIGSALLKAGERALMMYSSANHDERKWENPETFDIRRSSATHLGFGHGAHSCAGMHLARLEISSLLKALIPRVSRFELVGTPVYGINNVIRGLASLPIRIQPSTS